MLTVPTQRMAFFQALGCPTKSSFSNLFLCGVFFVEFYGVSGETLVVAGLRAESVGVGAEHVLGRPAVAARVVQTARQSRVVLVHRIRAPLFQIIVLK